MLTRRDLPNGQQATQSVHAAFLFARHFPDHVREWFDDSSYLVLLGVENAEALEHWTDRLEAIGGRIAIWREPDRNNELTAIAVGPSPAVERALSSLPLLLREEAMA